MPSEETKEEIGHVIENDATPWKPTHWKHKLGEAHNFLADRDYEQRVIDVAQKALSDIPDFGSAIFKVKWMQPGGEPVLIIEFTDPTKVQRFGAASASPSVGIGLLSVKKGALLETTAARTILEGDRLRDHILRSAHNYLGKHGIRVSLTPEEGMSHAHV